MPTALRGCNQIVVRLDNPKPRARQKRKGGAVCETGHPGDTASRTEAMPTKPDLQKLDAQARKDKNRLAVQRANERAKLVPGVMAFGALVQDWYDPQVGIGTRTPNAKKWFTSDRMVTPERLRKHTAGKESLAVTWGDEARVRVIDADVPEGHDPLDALPRLWDAIRALHLGRGGYVGPLVNGAIPEGIVLDGVIVTTPAGLHYIEITERPTFGDTLRNDVARVTHALRDQCVDVRYGHIEVLPGTNGQSRLPLGHGCAFVYPPLGKVDLETGVRTLRSLRPVTRYFPGLGPEFAEPPEAIHEEEPIPAEPITENPVVEETRAALALRRFAQLRNGNPPANQTGGNASTKGGVRQEEQRHTPGTFREKMEPVLRDGAATSQRNRQFWDLCILHRLTWGLPRDEAESHLTEWLDTAPHTSRDLRDRSRSARRAAQRLLHRHMDRIDAGLESGRFWLRAECASSERVGDPLLLVPETSEELAELHRLGAERLANVSMPDLPRWLRASLPRLVGAVMKWSRDGRIALPTATLEAYCKTRQAKRCPWTGKVMAAYRIALVALERLGVLGGVVKSWRKNERLAAIYEVKAPRIVVAAWPKHRNVKRKDAPWKREAFSEIREQGRASIRPAFVPATETPARRAARTSPGTGPPVIGAQATASALNRRGVVGTWRKVPCRRGGRSAGCSWRHARSGMWVVVAVSPRDSPLKAFRSPGIVKRAMGVDIRLHQPLAFVAPMARFVGFWNGCTVRVPRCVCRFAHCKKPSGCGDNKRIETRTSAHAFRVPLRKVFPDDREPVEWVVALHEYAVRFQRCLDGQAKPLVATKPCVTTKIKRQRKHERVSKVGHARQLHSLRDTQTARFDFANAVEFTGTRHFKFHHFGSHSFKSTRQSLIRPLPSISMIT